MEGCNGMMTICNCSLRWLTEAVFGRIKRTGRHHNLDKPARLRFSICQTQPKELQILRRQCCLVYVTIISIIIAITLCLMSASFPITNDHHQVCKSDFEVFEALACDSFTLKDSEHKREERRFKSDAWTQVLLLLVL